MPSDPAALIHRYYAAFNAHDADAFFPLLTEDVVHDLNQGTREVGKEAFRAFWDRMARAYREQISEITVMTSEDGRRAAAEYTVDGTYLATDDGLPEAHGQSYRLRGGAFFDLEDGRIARVTNHYNLDDWIRQVS